MHRPSTIERALELARSGRCASAAEVAAALKRERFESVDSHLRWPSLRKQINQVCAMAIAARSD